MSTDRITRVNEILKREIAELLFKVIREDSADLSVLTVTRVETDRGLRSARVFVSVRGDAATQQRMLETLRRHRVEIQAQMSRDVILKYTPRLQFETDVSVERGDRILQILSEVAPPDEAGDASPRDPGETP